MLQRGCEASDDFRRDDIQRWHVVPVSRALDFTSDPLESSKNPPLK